MGGNDRDLKGEGDEEQQQFPGTVHGKGSRSKGVVSAVAGWRHGREGRLAVLAHSARVLARNASRRTSIDADAGALDRGAGSGTAG